VPVGYSATHYSPRSALDDIDELSEIAIVERRYLRVVSDHETEVDYANGRRA